MRIVQFTFPVIASLVLAVATAAAAVSPNSQVQQETGLSGSNHLRGASEIDYKIINGDDAKKDRYPYYVALLDARGKHRCGGSLIAPDIVLSAAHCYR
jgi:V8-like Glu-specific endopeptidase